jgi:nucleoside-diphosphate-sugar epimerase
VTTLVIGGTGMVGPGVVRALADRHEEIVVLHRGLTREPFGPEVEVVQADRLDPAAVRAAIDRRGVDTVIDLACFGPEDAGALRAAVPPGVRVVVVSTVLAYGPLTAGPLHEGRACRPVSEYGRRKLEADRIVEEALPATIVRLGPCFREACYLDGQLFEDSYWLQGMVAGDPLLLADGGTARWNLIHAGDAGRAIAGLAACEAAAGETVVVGSQRTRSWREQYELVAAGLGREVRLVAADSAWLRERISDPGFLDEASLWNQDYDLSKLRRLLPQYREEVDLAAALVRTAAAALEDGELGDPELALEARQLAAEWEGRSAGQSSSITTG